MALWARVIEITYLLIFISMPYFCLLSTKSRLSVAVRFSLQTIHYPPGTFFQFGSIVLTGPSNLSMFCSCFSLLPVDVVSALSFSVKVINFAKRPKGHHLILLTLNHALSCRTDKVHPAFLDLFHLL